MIHIKTALVTTVTDDDGKVLGRTGLVGDAEVVDGIWEQDRRHLLSMALNKFMQDVPEELPAQLDRLADGEIIEFDA